jgi:hypothetical protein
MRKYNLLIVLGVLSLMLSVASYAQETPSPAPAAAPQGQETQTPPPSQAALVPSASDQFNAYKQKLLENISEHIAKMQQKQACISAATDDRALYVCFAGEAKANALVPKQ